LVVNFKRYRDIFIVLAALAVPFWFLRASMKDPNRVSGPDRIIVKIASPIQYTAATLARGISSIWGDYVYLVDVKDDNKRLASENARLRDEVHKLESEREENHRLKRLLDMKTSVKADMISAVVIGKNTNEFFRVLRISLDREGHDIVPNLPVLSADGVVGTTFKVSGDTVDVKLAVDAGSGVDVIVERTGARGFAKGAGDETKYLMNIEFVQRTDEVEVGDRLITSGVGRRFPKGIPVGTVTQVVRRDFGIYQQVVATPAVDFSRLEEVLIVTSMPGEESASRDAPGQTPSAPSKGK
jgi:rod shape-determining protein MreC